ncbi:MAG: glycolate oxidase [Thermodesulfobacteriota bacterium]|nr:glycolate oxidase [Thermodesulfobacteriota bacterium]
MKQNILDELVSCVGKGRASYAPEDLVAYSYDPFIEEHRPDIVVYPLSTEEVSAVMKVAYRESIPVVPRGSGTNLAGETVPVKGGIVLALSKMDKILEIDSRNRIAKLQPGVINFDFQQAVEKHGLMYPPDPSSWKMATMGGTVATNAGGPKTLKYGVTRDYLLGLRVILANGDVLKTGGVAIKNVTGYDLTRLICGSEGTLGIVTEMTVRLVPKPKGSRTIRADFPKLEDSSNAVADIIGEGIVPAGLEIMDKVVISAVEADTHMGLPLDVDAILIIEVDGEPAALQDQVSRIEGVLTKNNASGIVVAKDQAEAEKLWSARRAAFSVMARLRPNAVIEDATVPVSNLTLMINKTRKIALRHNVQIGVLAHAGDGNLHPVVLFDQRDQAELQRVDADTEEIFREALALGGTLSGEHGIGMAKARFLSMELDPVAMRVSKNIKSVLDPKNILNPGKFI